LASASSRKELQHRAAASGGFGRRFGAFDARVADLLEAAEQLLGDGAVAAVLERRLDFLIAVQEGAVVAHDNGRGAAAGLRIERRIDADQRPVDQRREAAGAEIELHPDAGERSGRVARPVQPPAVRVQAQRHAQPRLPEGVHLLRDLDLLDALEFVLARGAVAETRRESVARPLLSSGER